MSMGPVLCNSLIARAPPSTMTFDPPSTSSYQSLASHLTQQVSSALAHTHNHSERPQDGPQPLVLCTSQCFSRAKGSTPISPGHRVHLCEVMYILIINNSIIINNNSIIIMMMMMVIMTLFLLLLINVNWK